MHIFIDFDYTLFDTNEMRKGLHSIFAMHGVSEEQFADAERVVKGSGMYTIEAHVAAVSDLVRDTESLLAAANRLLQNTAPYLYSDAVDFMERHSDSHFTILSFGNEDWQRLKIQNSGLVSKNVMVQPTSQPKVDYVQQWCVANAEDAVFINDRGSEIDQIHAQCPSVRTVWIRREGAPYTEEHCAHASEEYTDLSFTLK